MIKKAVFEDDLIAGMQRKLAEAEVEQGMDSLPQAVDYINSAVDILEEEGKFASADQLLGILLKIAQKHHKKKVNKPIGDKHHPISSEQMIKNLLQHGTVFNMADDGNASDDLLDADIPDELEVDETNISSSKPFEEE
jgi:hypothetical protein